MKKIKFLIATILVSSMLSTTSVFAAENTAINQTNNSSKATVQNQCVPNHMDTEIVTTFNPNEKIEGSENNALASDLTVDTKQGKDNLQVNNLSSASESGIISYFDIWAEANTASGDKAADGAAHRTIPFYTSVSVNNAYNGQSISVRILDRGPYVSGRILDMAQESFSKVADINDGLFNGSISW